MRLKISKSKNASSLYVIKSTYKNKKHSSKIVEKLGTYDDLKEKLNGEDPIQWAENYIADLNEQEKNNNRTVMIKCSPAKQINKGNQQSFNGGYLFLQDIYHKLNLHDMCKEISEKYKFTFNLDSILSRLIYGRFIFPSSKLATCQQSKQFMEQPDFEIQHIYRALEVISKEMDFMQTFLYNNSVETSNRKTGVLYYDCTNFFFEIEEESGMKKYGFSKEHRPNPIVQMGMMIDGDGIPLAFCINDGNTNEQVTLQPLEKKILSDFELSKFIVCTDAGLASAANRKFNTEGDRAFITTQSIKKLKKFLREWALDPKGWRLSGNPRKTYDISTLDETEKEIREKMFYKERWINEDGLEQKIVVTYSIKYKDYHRQIRNNQIERAQKTIDKNPTKLKKVNANDYRRLIKKSSITSDGEIAKKDVFSINDELIRKEEVFDGFYAVCTNLEDDAQEIIKVNQRRWEIEECFRIMKSEFKARPVYLSRDDRIKAHFTICFISLVIYRLLEKKLNYKYTCPEIIKGLRDMNFLEIDSEGYIPTYTRNDFTDDLHDAFGFRTDLEIVNSKTIKKIFKSTKS